jgi:hypothetical protein
LSTTKGAIYVESATICFTNKGNEEKFSFKDRTLEDPINTYYLEKPIYKEEQVRKTYPKGKKNKRQEGKKTQIVKVTEYRQARSSFSFASLS